MLYLQRLFVALTILLAISINLCSAAAHFQEIKDAANVHARDEWQPNASSFVCLFLTSGVNWQGEAQNLCEIGGQCSDLLPDGLTSNVSSAGPTEGQTCFLYTAENCTGNSSTPISYPGYADLSAIGFLKKAVSWRCYKWCGYMGPASTSTTTIVVTPTKTMGNSAVNAAAVTNRDVSISTTLSAMPTTSSSSSSTVSISTTNSSSASSTSSVHASVLSPLPDPPAPVSEMSSNSASPSSSAGSISTTLTTGTSSTAPSTSTPPRPTLLPMLSSSTIRSGTGTGNTPPTSMITYLITATHTYGGRGGSWTTLTTISMVEPVAPGATTAPVQRI